MKDNTSEGFIYLVHAVGTNRIKVGHTFSPESRLRQLRTASPFPLRVLACWPGSVSAERRVHALLSQYRKVGEWFEVPPFVGRRILAEVKKQTTKAAVFLRPMQPTVQPHRSPQSNLWDSKLWRQPASGPPMPRSFTCVPHLSIDIKSVKVVDNRPQIFTETVTGWQIQVSVSCVKCGERYRPVAGFISPRVFAYLRLISFSRQCEVVQQVIESRLRSKPLSQICRRCSAS
jgi:hypothetical protein